MLNRLLLAITLGSMTCLMAPTARGSSAYGSDSSSRLHRIDSSTGASALVAADNAVIAAGLAFERVSGAIYTTGRLDSVLRTVDLANGATSDIGPSNGTTMVGLAFDSASAGLYAPDRSANLLRIDKATGAATTIGREVFSMLDLAVNSAGVLFAGGDGIGIFDLASGVFTPIGDAALQWTAIAFDAAEPDRLESAPGPRCAQPGPAAGDQGGGRSRPPLRVDSAQGDRTAT